MTDRPFPGESSAPHRGLRQYPPVPPAPGTHLGGYGVRSHMWPQQAMIHPPLPRGRPSLPRPVPMQFNPLHMAGRMPPQASHFPLPPQMTHQPNGNPLPGLNNVHRHRELLSAPWQQPMNALHARPRSAPSEGACVIDEEAELRGMAHSQGNELLAAGRGIEERTSNGVTEASVIVRKGPAAMGEMSRTMHHPRRCASDESTKFRSTSVIVNNRSASPRGTTYPIPTLTPTLKAQPTQPIQHLPNQRAGMSSISFTDGTAATNTITAYSTSDATSGVAKDLFVMATSTLPVAPSAVLSTVVTASSVTPPTTRGATAATLSNIATSSSVAPPISASSNVIAPPTGSAPTTICASTAPRSLPTAALQTTSSVQLSAATETTVLSTRPVATPSMATPPSFTSSSLSASLPTVGATMRQPHPSHPHVSSASLSAAKQSHLPARPVTVDAKPIVEDPRALDSTLPTSDQRVSCRTEETKSVVVDRPTCDAGYDSGPLGKDTFPQGTLCLKKRPASLLDCQSNAVSSTVKHEDKDNILSSCKRSVIASLMADPTLEQPMETQDNPRISPHPSGSAASDDSDVTFELDSYDEDDDRCNHSNLEMVSGEYVVADSNSMRVCTKCQKLVLKKGEKEQVVDLTQGDRSYIRACAPSTTSHGETPREYLIRPDMRTLLQSRREYMSNPDYPLPSSHIINLVYTPSVQNSTLTCLKLEHDSGEGIHTDVPANGKYKNGKQNRTSKASSRMKKGTAKSVIMPDSTDEASAMSGDCDSVALSDCSADGPTSAQRSSITGDSPSSSHLMDVESVPDVAEYSPAGSEQGRWSMNEVSELGAGLDTQTLELLQDFSPADVTQWKKLKVKRSTGETPLHQACSRGLMPMAKYFLQIERVCPNVQDNAGWTSLHEACSHRHHSVARLLLDHGANPSVCAHDGTMPIHDAVEANDLAGVKLLVEYGASIAPESGERLPLEIAKSKGFLSIVEYLQELMDMSSRAEVKSAKGHTSQDGTYFEDAKLAGQSYKLDEFRLGPELDYPLFLLSPFFDECEQTIPVAFSIRVPNESSGRHHNFYLMDDLVKVSGLSEANVRTALQETGLSMHVTNAPEFRAQVKTSEIYTIPRNLRNSHKQVELVPDCSVMRDLLGIRRVDIEQ